MKIATHVLYIDFLNVEMFTSTVNFEDTRIKGFNSLKKKKKRTQEMVRIWADRKDFIFLKYLYRTIS